MAWLLFGWLTYEAIVASWYPAAAIDADRQPAGAQTLPIDDPSFQALPVTMGRVMPLATASAELARQITGSESFERISSETLLLQWVFHAAWRSELRQNSQRESADGQRIVGVAPPQHWFDVAPPQPWFDWESHPFIRCEHAALRSIVFEGSGGDELDAHRSARRHVSPRVLRDSPGFARLVREAASLRAADPAKGQFQLSEEQRKAEEVARRLALYDALCGRSLTRLQGLVIAGEGMLVVPDDSAFPPADDAVVPPFVPPQFRHVDPVRVIGLPLLPAAADAVAEPPSLASSPTGPAGTGLGTLLGQLVVARAGGDFRQPLHPIHESLRDAYLSFQARDASGMQAGLSKFTRHVTAEFHTAPTSEVAAAAQSAFIGAELWFHAIRPFRWAWVLMLGAAVTAGLSLGSRWKWPSRVAMTLYAASLFLQLYGLAVRVLLSGRVPVGTVYETVIWAAFAAAILAVWLDIRDRRGWLLLAGSLVSTLSLLLADQLPLALDPAIGNLTPVLETNFWLAVHVLTIVSGYAAAMLAWGLGNVTLFVLAYGKPDAAMLKALSGITYRALQVTVFLLATGTFLGGWWAAEAWGRFWGWDPKEVGALVALISYVLPLHARYVGWIREFGLALSAVACFAMIVISWYVVNFVLATGLHSYGFGGREGMIVVAWACAANLVFLLVAARRYLRALHREPLLAGIAAG